MGIGRTNNFIVKNYNTKMKKSKISKAKVNAWMKMMRSKIRK